MTSACLAIASAREAGATIGAVDGGDGSCQFNGIDGRDVAGVDSESGGTGFVGVFDVTLVAGVCTHDNHICQLRSHQAVLAQQRTTIGRYEQKERKRVRLCASTHELSNEDRVLVLPPCSLGKRPRVVTGGAAVESTHAVVGLCAAILSSE